MKVIPKEIKKFYHCTTEENMLRILDDGLKTGPDGLIYLADSLLNSAKFLVIRGYKPEDLVVIEIPRKLLENDKLSYSADHSIDFFKCDAYQYSSDISDEIISKSNFYKVDRKVGVS